MHTETDQHDDERATSTGGQEPDERPAAVDAAGEPAAVEAAGEDANFGRPLGYLSRDAGLKDTYLRRLRRIEGQVRGLHRMVEQDAYCIDVLTQVSATTRALQSVALGLLEEHLAHCVAEAAAKGGPEADQRVREAAEAISRLVRS